MEVIFSQYPIKIKSEKDAKYIYDIVRKKWVKMTSEEQVRQMWLHYLTQDLGYANNMIAVEKELKIADKSKRFDICVYGSGLKPNILIECKAPDIDLKLPAWEQLFTYNLNLSAKKFIVTNGLHHIGYEIEGDEIKPIKKLEKL